MEEVLGGLGIAALVVLALVGAVIGYCIARALARPGRWARWSARWPAWRRPSSWRRWA